MFRRLDGDGRRLGLVGLIGRRPRAKAPTLEGEAPPVKETSPMAAGSWLRDRWDSSGPPGCQGHWIRGGRGPARPWKEPTRQENALDGGQVPQRPPAGSIWVNGPAVARGRRETSHGKRRPDPPCPARMALRWRPLHLYIVKFIPRVGFRVVAAEEPTNWQHMAQNRRRAPSQPGGVCQVCDKFTTNLRLAEVTAHGLQQRN